MDRFRRLTAIGCAGAILLCLGSIFVPFLYRAGNLALARQRWAEKGNADYSLVVAQFCNCYLTGVFRITVQNGHVIAVEPVRTTMLAVTFDPRAFDHLTVEASFERAQRVLLANWLPNWQRPIAIQYDQDLGFVSRLETDQRGGIDAHFLYRAREIELPQRP